MAEFPTSLLSHRGRTPGILAYTLVEILIVLVVIGILAVAAIPSFSNAVEEQRAKAAAERIRADLQLARQYAVATNKATSVLFDVAARRYTLVGVPNPNGKQGDYVVDLTAMGFEIGSLVVDFGGAKTVSFDAYGSASADGLVTVVSEDSTVTLSVKLERTSGDAEVVK